MKIIGVDYYKYHHYEENHNELTNEYYMPGCKTNNRK